MTFEESTLDDLLKLMRKTNEGVQRFGKAYEKYAPPMVRKRMTTEQALIVEMGSFLVDTSAALNELIQVVALFIADEDAFRRLGDGSTIGDDG